jgi:hypothetical protein
VPEVWMTFISGKRIETLDGLPKETYWQIQAEETYDRVTKLVTYVYKDEDHWERDIKNIVKDGRIKFRAGKVLVPNISTEVIVRVYTDE